MAKDFDDYLASEQGWNDNVADFSAGTSSPSKEPTFEALGNGLHGLMFAVGDDRNIAHHEMHDVLSYIHHHLFLTLHLFA